MHNSPHLGKARISPIRDGLAASLILILIASASAGLIFFRSTHVFSEQIREEFSWIAKASASLVDGDVHKTLRLPEQENTKDYEKAVTPLRSVLAALPEVRFIYTVIPEQDGTIRFVLDSAAVGDKDGDGVQDHSFLMDVYEDPDQELIEATKRFDVRVSKNPYTDTWGTFISAYAPILDSANVPVGVVGVDIKAQDYLRRLQAIHHAVLTGFLFQFFVSALVGLLVYLLRRNALQAELNEKNLQAQLLQSQKMETVGTLAGGIAHDLNNQLSPVSGYIDLLLQDTKPEESSHALLMEAKRSTQRCIDIVARLLNFSRPSKVQQSVFGLDRMLLELERFIKTVFPSNISIEIIHEPNLWPLEGNESEIQTVFMNLAANAKDAMAGKGGQLVISAQNFYVKDAPAASGNKSGDYVRIDVRDTGGGISPQHVSRIFEPFFTTKRKEGGSGLGLAMVYSIIRSYHGWIEVESELGKGTVFHVYFPAAQPVKEITQEEPQKSLLPKGSETILFADDEDALRDLGKSFLERLGYKVLIARDGEEAVQMYTKNQESVALVIMDMTMPKLTGKQTIQRLLQINPKVKIILSSGYTAEGTAEELISAGAYAFLDKPYTLAPLANIVRKTLDGV